MTERRRPAPVVAAPAARRRPGPSNVILADRSREVEGRTGGLYFASEKAHLKFIHSGSTMLDNALGGGWILGRVANIIGDKSTGKTLLAIEACANFAKAYPRGKIYYRERESAFDIPYAQNLGLPTSRVDFGPKNEKRFNTVEGFAEDLDKVIQASKVPGLYILDSLDSLSDEGEMDRKVGDASYGTAKAKQMSEMFRKLVRPMEDAEITLLIISQIRDKIGVTFGKKTTRSGGHALDFYASQVVELAHLGHIFKTIQSVKRSIGIEVRAKMSKNKIALPFREARFDIKFGYGVEDLTSCMDWLIEVDRIGALGLTKSTAVDFLIETNKLPDEEYDLRVAEVAATTKVVWREIESQFLPRRRKY